MNIDQNKQLLSLSLLRNLIKKYVMYTQDTTFCFGKRRRQVVSNTKEQVFITEKVKRLLIFERNLKLLIDKC